MVGWSLFSAGVGDQPVNTGLNTLLPIDVTWVTCDDARTIQFDLSGEI
jgi:hypothetical protein